MDVDPEDENQPEDVKKIIKKKEEQLEKVIEKIEDIILPEADDEVTFQDLPKKNQKRMIQLIKETVAQFADKNNNKPDVQQFLYRIVIKKAKKQIENAPNQKNVKTALYFQFIKVLFAKLEADIKKNLDSLKGYDRLLIYKNLNGQAQNDIIYKDFLTTKEKKVLRNMMALDVLVMKYYGKSSPKHKEHL